MVKKNLVIAHGGGPTPVINASLAGVIMEAQKHTKIDKILAARGGIEGLLAGNLTDLSDMSPEDIDLLKNTPGSAIGTCRYKVTEKDYSRTTDVLQKHNIGYFFYNGGNDSMDTCHKVSLLANDIAVIGIPKTIDNDLGGTDHCPGFGSAARYAAVTALELGMDIRALPIHVCVLEIMGRNAGWLVGATALARTQGFKAPQLICFPERPFDEGKFLNDVQRLWDSQKGIVIAASEGLVDHKGNTIADSGLTDGFGHKIPGGVAQTLSNLIISKLHIKSRSEKPGLIGRASKLLVSPVDREEAFEAGKISVQQAASGKTGFMVGIKRLSNDPYRVKFELVELDKVANYEKKLPDHFINADGNNVTDEFIEYCRPLTGGDFPDYFNIDNYE
ncbi:MAG: 6-phosphofructokinase [Spirochaetales bacterium]|nr:6-phosphofructokinase [Spirochaetales bacterium]